MVRVVLVRHGTTESNLRDARMAISLAKGNMSIFGHDRPVTRCVRRLPLPGDGAEAGVCLPAALSGRAPPPAVVVLALVQGPERAKCRVALLPGRGHRRRWRC